MEMDRLDVIHFWLLNLQSYTANPGYDFSEFRLCYNFGQK